jgi:hypothetical protein
MKRRGVLWRLSNAPNGKLPDSLRTNDGATVGKTRATKRLTLLIGRHREMLTISDLLLRATAIEMDLDHRLSQEPGNKVLLKRRKEYQILVGRLAREHRAAMAAYMAAIRYRWMR